MCRQLQASDALTKGYEAAYLRAGMDVTAKRKICVPVGNQSPVVQPVVTVLNHRSPAPQKPITRQTSIINQDQAVC